MTIPLHMPDPPGLTLTDWCTATDDENSISWLPSWNSKDEFGCQCNAPEKKNKSKAMLYACVLSQWQTIHKGIVWSTYDFHDYSVCSWITFSTLLGSKPRGVRRYNWYVYRLYGYTYCCYCCYLKYSFWPFGLNEKSKKGRMQIKIQPNSGL